MILGIDTSNYKCSVSLLDNEKFIINYSEFLSVKHGTLGLRQSDAFFQHIQILNSYLKKIPNDYIKLIRAIGVSDKPRRLEKSYMPVFNAGVFMAECFAKALGVKVYKFSHQEGHYGAAIRELDVDFDEETLFFHISGGTSEILKVNKSKNAFDMKNILSTSDLSFGQLIDRIGVAMELPFPCGKKMEDLAYIDFNSLDYPDELNNILKAIPSLKIKTGYNLSGYENIFKKYLEKNYNKSIIITALFIKIGEFIIDLVREAFLKTGIKKIILSGGVMANNIIKKVICASDLYFEKDLQIYFPSLENCGDSAIGPAYLTQIFIKNSGEKNETKN